MHPLLAFFSFSATEMLVIMVIAVLLFGKRLPEVARSLGKNLVEFKKGIHSIQEELQASLREEGSAANAHVGSADRASPDDHEEATAPKFEPPASVPDSQPETPKESAEV